MASKSHNGQCNQWARGPQPVPREFCIRQCHALILAVNAFPGHVPYYMYFVAPKVVGLCILPLESNTLCSGGQSMLVQQEGQEATLSLVVAL